jgi:hypothetical protein
MLDYVSRTHKDGLERKRGWLHRQGARRQHDRRQVDVITDTRNHNCPPRLFVFGYSRSMKILNQKGKHDAEVDDVIANASSLPHLQR